MVTIARQILLHDRLRFAITVVSLGFAIVVVVYDLGMFFGTITDSVNVIDRSPAQLWIADKDSTALASPSRVPDMVLRRLPGAALAITGAHIGGMCLRASALGHEPASAGLEAREGVDVPGGP